MPGTQTHVVTGAFGFSGKYIARRLLDQGRRVRTLTNSPDRKHGFGDAVEAHRFHFDAPEKLTASLAGASVLYNTYWVRFNHRRFKHSEAVDNTLALFRSAKEAGVERIVHVSITNASLYSGLEYFCGKAHLEMALHGLGVSYSILRPAVLFGPEDVLVNNIAWMLRRLPVFGVFGRGDYRIRPIHVDDLAELAVNQGNAREDGIVNAVGPESFTFRELVETIGRIIGKRRPIVSVPPTVGYWTARLLGLVLRDVVLTREEIRGLMDGLLDVDSPSTGKTKLTEWAAQNASTLGVRYASELARRRDRASPYVEG